MSFQASALPMNDRAGLDGGRNRPRRTLLKGKKIFSSIPSRRRRRGKLLPNHKMLTSTVSLTGHGTFLRSSEKKKWGTFAVPVRTAKQKKKGGVLIPPPRDSRERKSQMPIRKAQKHKSTKRALASLFFPSPVTGRRVGGVRKLQTSG